MAAQLGNSRPGQLPIGHHRVNGGLHHCGWMASYPIIWLREVDSWNPPYEFVDTQAQGPDRLRHRTNRFSETSRWLTDALSPS